MDRHKLESLTREELVALAGELGIVRPRSLTVPELMDEIVLRTVSSEREKARSRGWFGRARSLLASVIERGLHLPEVAKALRHAPSSRPWPAAPTPLATMTLAEIYAAQGHLDKALHILDEILSREPEHADARSLRQRLDAQNSGKKKPEPPSKREEPSTVQVSKALVAEEAVQPPADATAEAVETNDTVVAAAPEVVTEAIVAAPVIEVAVVAPETEEITPPPVAAATEEPAAPIVSFDNDEPVEAESFEDEASVTFDSYERPSIEELPLPERYNVDEIVGIAVDPTTVYVYWEVRPIVLARAHSRLSDGAMVVRLISVTPSWDGPVVEQRDLTIDALYGDVYVRGLRPGSNVRIGVGWLAHGTFAPFAIGEPVETPRKELALAKASTVARWMPTGAPAAGASGQTTVAMLTTALERASTSTEEAPFVAVPSFDRELLGEGWPTFDLGARGLSANEKRGAARSALGGSSEQSPGGASDLVRPTEHVSD